MNIMGNLLRLLFYFISFFYFLILCVFALAPYWPEEIWWLANVLQPLPLWPLGIPAAFFSLLALVTRDRGGIVVAVSSALILLFGVMGFQGPWPRQFLGTEPPRYTLRVMTINLGGKVDLPALLKLIKEENPDIIAFQEASSISQSFLSHAGLPDSQWDLHLDKQLGLASRFEIVNFKSLDRRMIGRGEGFVGRYELKGPHGPIQFFNVHLETPRRAIETLLWERRDGFKEMLLLTERQEKESQAASRLAGASQAAVLAGDFNMLQSSPVFRKYWSRWADAFAKAGSGFGYTKHTRWHGARIDHVLYDPDSWMVQRVRVGPDLGGDHRPVIADLAFRERP